MSGTSADAADAALVRFGRDGRPLLLATHHTPLPADIRRQVLALFDGEALGPLEYGRLDVGATRGPRPWAYR